MEKARGETDLDVRVLVRVSSEMKRHVHRAVGGVRAEAQRRKRPLRARVVLTYRRPGIADQANGAETRLAAQEDKANGHGRRRENERHGLGELHASMGLGRVMGGASSTQPLQGNGNEAQLSKPAPQA